MGSDPRVAQRNIERFVVTGATGFIGKEFLIQALKKYPEAKFYLLSRREPPFQNERIQYVHADFSSTRSLDEALSKLETLAEGGKYKALVHFAAVIVAKSRSEAQRAEQINVGATCRLLAWSDEFAERMIVASSIVAFGATVEDKIRNEDAVDSFNPMCWRLPYFSTKHRAQEQLLNAGNSRTWILCPGIVHGPGEEGKNSRPHLEWLREGRLRYYPPGGAAFVSLDFVVKNFLHACEAESEGSKAQLRLLVQENLSFREYFQFYLECCGRSDLAGKLRPFPGLVSALLTFSLKNFPVLSQIPLVSKLLPSQLFLYFKSKYELVEGESFRSALSRSLQIESTQLLNS